MPRYHYMRKITRNIDWLKESNELGATGWELVGPPTPLDKDPGWSSEEYCVSFYRNQLAEPISAAEPRRVRPRWNAQTLARAIRVEHWEAHDEYILTVAGIGPVGSTMREVDANRLREWLIYNYATLSRVFGVIEKEEA